MVFLESANLCLSKGCPDDHTQWNWDLGCLFLVIFYGAKFVHLNNVRNTWAFIAMLWNSECADSQTNSHHIKLPAEFFLLNILSHYLYSINHSTYSNKITNWYRDRNTALEVQLFSFFHWVNPRCHPSCMTSSESSLRRRLGIHGLKLEKRNGLSIRKKFGPCRESNCGPPWPWRSALDHLTTMAAQ